jgi:CDP-glucose 4,6-dehydratase
VRESFRNPLNTIGVNVMGTANLLDAVRHVSGVRGVVVVTSDKCYENREWVWGYRESDEMGGHDTYSGSKGAAELIVSCYRRSFFHGEGATAVATARAGNVIGGGDFATDRLLPDCIRAIECGRAVRVRRPDATRPWQHVLDPLRGYLKLAERLVDDGRRHAEAWNFGPSEREPQSVRWLCGQFSEAIRACTGRTLATEFIAPADDHHEAQSLRLDISKARERLGWRPTLSIAESIALTADWYGKYLANDDVRTLSLAQIEHFEKLSQRSATH